MLSRSCFASINPRYANKFNTVTWAQRSSASDKEKNHVFLTISVPDVSKEKIQLDLQPNTLQFQGYSETKKATYAVKLEFYAEIDPSASKINHTPRDVEIVLQKKELEQQFWPRLLKDKAKVHFLKTDFDKVREICSTVRVSYEKSD